MRDYKMFLLVFVCLSLMKVSEGFPKQKKFPVGSKQNPGNSCKDIKAHGGTENKNYYIIPLGGRTTKVYCDQTTSGGGWTLVWSYTFTNFNHFHSQTNAVTPRPSWPVLGDVRISTTAPLSEYDYNAMDFVFWKKLGSEFMVKSNINNWIACSEGTGSFVRWISGSLKCKIVKNVTGKCADICPDSFKKQPYPFNYGPVLYDSSTISTPTMTSYYFFQTLTTVGYPTHDPCGVDAMWPVLFPDHPHGNVYIR